jgi:putative transposase
MARLARLFAPSIVQHVVQRAVDGRVICADLEDYELLIRTLERAVRTNDLALHAYVLMPTEIQLLGTPARADSIARVMQEIGRRYVPHANRKANASGALWGGRFRSTLVDADQYLLPVMRHIEHRPVVTELVIDAESWRWSSHAHHVGFEQQTLITDHPRYWALSDAPFERQAAYRQFVRQPVVDHTTARIEEAVERGWALGAARFVEELHGNASRRPHPLSRGRPRSKATDA